jgi:polyferredoxin
MAAFAMAEVEPFKTAITLKFMRDWPFVVYAALLLIAGLFIERFFCRYLCPLGAALAIPARMRMFEWLKRYRECGAECQLCARTCTVQAIHPLGQINPNECIYCLQCQAKYFDSAVCLHIKKRIERRQPRAALPIKTPATAGASAKGAADGH